jgi:hypothetical protein
MREVRVVVDSGGELAGAFEKLLLRKNGGEKTVNDVCEFLVAMHHDSQARDKKLKEALVQLGEDLECHEQENVHLLKPDFETLIKGFEAKHSERDVVLRGVVSSVNLLEADVAILKEHCKEIVPEGAFEPEDEMLGDIKRAWRVARWFVLGISVPFVVALGNKLTEVLF